MSGKLKKAAKFLPLCALALCIAFAAAPNAAFAAQMPESVSAEIAAEKVWFPKLADLGQSYSIDLFAKDDTAFENRLNNEGEAFYTFGDVGEYLLRYTVYDGELAAEENAVPFFVTDTTAPTMTFGSDYENVYAHGAVVPIILPELSDNNPAGNSELHITVSVNGGEAREAEESISLTEAGTYAVEYTAEDKSGNTVTRVFTFVTGQADPSDTQKPEITVNGTYAQTANTGDEIEIYAASVSDNSGETIVAEVAVFLNGKILTPENGKVKLTEEGVCTIRYSAADSAGNAASATFSITVSEGGGCSCGATLGGGITGAVFLIAAGAVWLLVKRRMAQGRK